MADQAPPPVTGTVWKAPPVGRQLSETGGLAVPITFGEPSCTIESSGGRLSVMVKPCSGFAVGFEPVTV